MLGTITRSPLQIRLNDSHKVSVLVTTLPYPVAVMYALSLAQIDNSCVSQTSNASELPLALPLSLQARVTQSRAHLDA